MTTAPTQTAPPLPLTPAERRELAETNLQALGTLTAGTTAYNSRALTAVANSLIEISSWLQALTAILEPPPVPEIPGLPPDWKITAEQNRAGSKLWGYILTTPDGRELSNRHRWSTYGGAIDAGVRAARKETGT